MRNIAIADRRDWVFEAPKPEPARGPAPKRRVRNLLATLPILLLIPALLLPFMSTLAVGPRLTVVPRQPVAGKMLKVTAAGFQPGVVIVVRWNGTPMVRIKTNANGRFVIKFKVPKGAKNGVHTIKVTSVGKDRVVLARLKVQIGTSAARVAPKAEGKVAAAAKLTLSPARPLADKTLKVSANGLAPRVVTFTYWDNQMMVRVRTNTKGQYAISFTVPKAAKDGKHTIKVLAENKSTVLATLNVVMGAQPTTGPTTAPTTGPTSAPTSAPTTAPTTAPTAAPTTAPTSAPPAAPTPGHPSTLAGALYNAGDLAWLPMSGPAWAALKAQADSAIGSPNISDQDDASDINVLAAGLVYARTGNVAYRTKAIAAIKAAVQTENGGRTLALARNLPGYILAANLVNLPGVDPAFNDNTFKPWLRSLLTETLDGQTLTSTHERRPNNWGTHAGAARVAIALYLGDQAVLSRAAAVFHGWVGDRTAYAGFEYGDVTWQCDPSKPVGINPVCSKSGHAIGGALPDDMRRGGSFAWPPASTGYPWEALQGAVLEAELLSRAGYDAWNWENKALLRSAQFLYAGIGWPATGDDEWQTWLIDATYGTSYSGAAPANTGKNFGWTDWLYGS